MLYIYKKILIKMYNCVGCQLNDARPILTTVLTQQAEKKLKLTVEL